MVKRQAFAVGVFLAMTACAGGAAPKRPHIYGIAYVRIATSDMDKARDFYSLVLRSVPGLVEQEGPCDWCERMPSGVGIERMRARLIMLEPNTNPSNSDFLEAIAFRTDDAKGIRNYLQENHVAVEKLTKCGQDACFSVLDPEQHRLTFVQSSSESNPPTALPGA